MRSVTSSNILDVWMCINLDMACYLVGYLISYKIRVLISVIITNFIYDTIATIVILIAHLLPT